MMKIDILTLFPNIFKGPFSESIIKRAQKRGLVEIKIFNLRDFALDKHKVVDDKPYGGGAGMVLKVDVVDRALRKLKKKNSKVILLTPQGKRLNQNLVKKLSHNNHLILICGHYEGFDERIRKYLVAEEISIGDYILTGGELPAAVLTEAIIRLIPGVLGKSDSLRKESFSQFNKLTLLEYPQYTRPEKYKNWSVPKILLSGNHQKIEEWRFQEALKRTKKRRPDLLK